MICNERKPNQQFHFQIILFFTVTNYLRYYLLLKRRNTSITHTDVHFKFRCSISFTFTFIFFALSFLFCNLQFDTLGGQDTSFQQYIGYKRFSIKGLHFWCKQFNSPKTNFQTQPTEKVFTVLFIIFSRSGYYITLCYNFTLHTLK